MPTTPNCQLIERAVLTEFPDAVFSRYNCRHINSLPRFSWSQHAGSEPPRGYLGNALDIWNRNHVDNKGRPTATPTHQAWLRKVRAFITLTFGSMIDQMLGPGDNAAHANHIHTSPFPKMKSNWWYKPPCKGGKLIVIHEDGSTGNTFGTSPPPPPPGNVEDMVTRSTRGVEAEDFQRFLNSGGYTDADGNSLKTDGVPGNKTFQAWAKALIDIGWPAQTAGDEAASASAIAEVAKLHAPPGEDGRDGNDGRNGINGADGVDGQDGKDGDPGPQPTGVIQQLIYE